ncbi:hypothetical protein [Breznakia pachnodae]|uniref:Uncharacterized protein n=1 Tax=Breznakia pachnodae TaxID=265178 RepID=A0ABU0E5D1_9FIRM|nr:hypothetical protein [Breznakia pachnodae]MDQ0362117.1 hypothetical protein [Breznakia pachnodae]
MKKVKYPYFFNMERLIELAKNIDLEGNYNLIDILEFHNVLKFFININYPEAFPEQQVKDVKAKLCQVLPTYFENETEADIINDFKYMFNSSDSETLEEIDKKIKEGTLEHDSEKNCIPQYREDYLECFEKYNLAERIVEEHLEETIQDTELPIWLFLKTNYFIQNYPQMIKNLFLKDTRNVELVLNNYTSDFTGSKTKYYIPENITKKEMYQFFGEYIDNDFSNSNYLALIEQGIQGIKELNIDGKLKLKAKKKKEEIEKKLFYNEDGTFTDNGFSQKIAVYTDREKYESETLAFKCFIDLNWIKENKDPESLLNYLMYLEGFFTSNWISNLCSFPNHEASTIERSFGVKSQKHYETSFYFLNKNNLSLLSFKVFETFLRKELNTRVEDLINYFFTKYGEENFQISWLGLDFAKPDEKMSIQTKNLFTVEEHIRKQWNLLVEEKEIETELFELENTPRISSMKSFLNKKYIYVNQKNKDIQEILHLLFSDQSSIKYINENLSEENFVKLILKNRVNRHDFLNYQHQFIDLLIEKNIISIDEEEFLCVTIKQLTRITIFSNLYKFGVIHNYHVLDNTMILELQQCEVDEMIVEGILTYENKLFSKPETDFLNYILNNSEYDNALALRNKYLHSSIVNDNYEDYLYILIILVIYAVKINDELTLNEEIKDTNTENEE